jgi:xylulokinase
VSDPSSIDREEQFVLAVDLGTGGPKVGLVSMTGVIAWKEHQPVATHHRPDGTATQDAEEWWQLVLGGARRAIESGVVTPDRIAAVSCTGQWASTVPVDVAGRPTGACLLWSDTRGGPLTRQAVGGPVSGYSPAALIQWIRHSGGAPSTSGADPIGHILFVERCLPDVARATRWYLEPVDYLSMRFTGIAAASPASMAGAWLTDNRTPERLDYDPVLVRRSGVPVAKLPRLIATGSTVGAVSSDVARDLGLGDGVPVVTGTPDLHSAAAGSGHVLAYQAHVAISTTSWISCPFPKKKTDPIHQMATVPGFIPGLNLVANNQESGGRSLEWLRDCLFDQPEPPTYDTVTSLAEEAAPGSGGLLFTPWLAGERSPIDDRSARAGFHNLSLHTTRSDMVRAVMEGVAFNSRWLAEAVERFTRRPLGPIRAIGGGATSPLWCGIYADVLNRPIERVADPLHANLRGSALLAALALGRVRSDELSRLVPVDQVHHPDPSLRTLYDERFAEFPAFYSAQKGLFARMNRPRTPT